MSCRYQTMLDAIVLAIKDLNAPPYASRTPCTITPKELGLSYDPDMYVRQDAVRNHIMKVRCLLFETQDEFFDCLEKAIKAGWILKETGWASRHEAETKAPQHWVLGLPDSV